MLAAAQSAERIAEDLPGGQLDRGFGLGLMARKGPWIGVLWLGFLGFPLAELLARVGSPLHLLWALGLVAAFIALYGVQIHAWQLPSPARLMADRGGLSPLRLLALAGIAILLSSLERDGWAMLFIYTAAAGAITIGSRQVGPRGSERLGFAWVLGCSALAATFPALAGAGFSPSFTYGVSCLGVGLLTMSVAGLRMRNVELLATREQRAQLAVAEERLRFARDLHDLLGSSLSVVALKGELTRRLIERGQFEDASAHALDIEQVARAALAEVRDAVAGFRGAKLPRELERAELALKTAGIELHVHRRSELPGGALEDLIACTIREGATNVLKHSAAQRCEITLGSDGAVAFVEICDAGQGSDRGLQAARAVDAAGLKRPGHGLEGLRERALSLGGELQANAGADGFRLHVSAPLDLAAR